MYQKLKNYEETSNNNNYKYNNITIIRLNFKKKLLNKVCWPNLINKLGYIIIFMLIFILVLLLVKINLFKKHSNIYKIPRYLILQKNLNEISLNQSSSNQSSSNQSSLNKSSLNENSLNESSLNESSLNESSLSAFERLEKSYELNSLDFNNILPRISLDNNKIPTLEEVFNSKVLYISDANLTRDYIKYIRPLNDQENITKDRTKEIIIPDDIFKKREGQYDFKEFGKLCLEEKLISTDKIEYNNKPSISVILPSYNKEDFLLKSVRSIQNQSFKNIEIIIVNDCSTDNSSKIFDYLLNSDPRIRIFNHLKNLGLWRSRLNGILYSKGKYIIHFDPGDLYEDNYILEDSFNLMEKYNFDSAKFNFRLVFNLKDFSNSKVFISENFKTKIKYGPTEIQNADRTTFNGWGNIWVRIVKKDIYSKGLYLLNNIILNIYKNMWEDVWNNAIISKASQDFLIFNRVGYLYVQETNSEGRVKAATEKQRDKTIKEYLGFLYFDLNMMDKIDNKNSIIEKLRKYDSNHDRIKLEFLKTKFNMLHDLLNVLIDDPYVSENNKRFLKQCLEKSKLREETLKNIDNY